MGPRAVLFDMDDTLIDWPAAIDVAIGTALTELGPTATADAADHLWAEIRALTWHQRNGTVVDRAHWRLRNEPRVPIDRAFPDSPAEARRRAADLFAAELRPPLFADVLPALNLLSKIRLGVLSNSPVALMALQQHGIAGRFHSVTMADDPYRKPHIRAFEEACSAIGHRPVDVAFVGDSITSDVEGAIAAGLHPVIWLDRFDDPSGCPSGASRISSLSDLPSLL
ncbi:MAG: HAD family hydrolase [Dehalococcoidia bacterium]